MLYIILTLDLDNCFTSKPEETISFAKLKENYQPRGLWIFLKQKVFSIKINFYLYHSKVLYILLLFKKSYF